MKIGIIGSGTMGTGIAQVAATVNYQVCIYDYNPEALLKSKSSLEKILNRLIEKARIDEATKNAILSNISFGSELQDLADSALIIEAIIEDEGIKKKVFQEVESIVSDDCILASNTSSLSITSLAAACKIPSRFIGLHFFNPAPLMKLVEIIPAIQTDQKCVDSCVSIIADFKKTTVLTKDTPGFIVNKVARPFYAEALRIYEEGLADFATIDAAMKNIAGFRMGPFALMDYIGNDVNYAVTETVFKAFYFDPRYKPSFTQKRLAEAGYLGRKSGKGFYNYVEGTTIPEVTGNEELQNIIADRIVIMLINEAADTLYTGIANEQDIETAMTTGVNYPKGLLAWANEKGIEDCVKQLDSLYEYYHEDRYRCCPLLRTMARDSQTFNV